MIIKTLIPQQKDTYSSFPTITRCQDKFYVFYRQGTKNTGRCHGLMGTVRCYTIPVTQLWAELNSCKEIIYDPARDQALPFSSENELDAIVSHLDDNLYSLVTRTYMQKIINRPHGAAHSLSWRCSDRCFLQVCKKGREGDVDALRTGDSSFTGSCQAGDG